MTPSKRVLEVIKISLVDFVGLNWLVNYYHHHHYYDSSSHYFREKMAFTLRGFATRHIKFLVARLNYLHIKSYVTWIMVLAGICLQLCHSNNSQKDVSISAVFNAEHVKNDLTLGQEIPESCYLANRGAERKRQMENNKMPKSKGSKCQKKRLTGLRLNQRGSCQNKRTLLSAASESQRSRLVIFLVRKEGEAIKTESESHLTRLWEKLSVTLVVRKYFFCS